MNNRQAALKAAVDFYGKGENSEQVGGVLAISDQFLAWLQGGSTGGVAHPAPVTTQAAENPQPATTSSGYDKFKQQGSRLADKREDEAIHETLMEQQGYEDLPADW